MAVATYAAVAINLAVAAASYALAGHTPVEAVAGESDEEEHPPLPNRLWLTPR